MNFFKINSKGDLLNVEGNLVQDNDLTKKIISSITLKNNVYLTAEDEIVEVYNFVYIVSHIDSVEGEILHCKGQYDLPLKLNLREAFLNYEDKFIIYTFDKVPAMLSDVAQEQLFDMSDEFSDDSITIRNVNYLTPAWLKKNSLVTQPKFWSEQYIEQKTPWDLGKPSPSLVWALQKFKLPKMRIAVLGCGSGHDAHYFSSLGHKTIGFDFSSEALQVAKKQYGENSNLKWCQQDLLNLETQYFQQFDLVFDHTLYCAIDPNFRSDLVKTWERLLTDQGQILGVFFTMPKVQGPPYGATEAEISQRIGSYFRTDFWMRSRVSAPSRMGTELIVLATKVDL